MGRSPNTKRQNLKCLIFEFSFSGSSSQKKRSISRSLESIPTMRNAFSMSADIATGFHLNLTRTSKRCGIKFGPVSKKY